MSGNLFYGFCVNNESLRQNLMAFSETNRSVVPRATWTGEGKFHVTLLFLGKGPSDTYSDRLTRVCAGKAPFVVKASGAGIFTNREGPRVLYAELSPVAVMRTLHSELGGKGMFNPHLTLAKLEEKGDFAPEFKTLASGLTGHEFGSALIESIKLYRTVGDGAPYEVVAEHRLVTV